MRSRSGTFRQAMFGAASSTPVGSYKRNLILPQSLKRMAVREANFAGDHLEILFGRAPAQAEGS